MGGRPSPCYIVDKITGEIVSKHPSICDAARTLGKNETISRQVKTRKLIWRCPYVIRLVDDYDPHEDFEGIREGIPVMCIYDDYVDIYEDAPLVIETLMLSKSALNGGLRNPTRRICGQFRVSRLPHMGACNELIKRGVAHIKRRQA